MIVRKATVDNVESVYNLICELEKEELNLDQFKEVYLNNLNNPSVFYFVCENDNRIIAFASLQMQCLLHHCSNVAEVQELIVTKEYRGKGIGKELIKVLERTAKENGCTLLEVCCNQKRIRSHAFYEHCGMTKSHYKFTYDLDQL